MKNLTFAEATRALPNGPNGKPLTYFTLRNWTLRGLRCRNGERVILKHKIVDEVKVTTDRWLSEFVEQIMKNEAAAFGRRVVVK